MLDVRSQILQLDISIRDMKLYSIHRMMTCKVIFIGKIIFTELISLQVVKATEERTKRNVHFAEREPNWKTLAWFFHSGKSKREEKFLRHANTYPTSFAKRHKGFPHSLLIRSGKPPLGNEFMCLRKVFLVLVKYPGGHRNGHSSRDVVAVERLAAFRNDTGQAGDDAKRQP